MQASETFASTKNQPGFIIGALGDSITTGFNAHSPQDNWHYSWSTGLSDLSEISSHAVRLKQIFPHLHVTTQNAAVAGARVSALRSQTDQLLLTSPDYVTLLIGANDLVHWTGDTASLLASYKIEVETCIRRIITANPRVLILIAGIPNQAHLLELALAERDDTSQLNRFAQYLPLLSPSFLASLRALYLERWEALNGALDQLARSMPANIRYSARVALARFGKEHLSPLDSYHPSLLGQRLLAETTWADGWFP